MRYLIKVCFTISMTNNLRDNFSYLIVKKICEDRKNVFHSKAYKTS